MPSLGCTQVGGEDPNPNPERVWGCLCGHLAAYRLALLSMLSGICLSVVPLYLGEIAPKNLRGFLGLLPSIFICLGVFCAQVLGLPELLGQVSRMGYHPMGYCPMGCPPVGCPPKGLPHNGMSPLCPYRRPCTALPMTHLHLCSPQDRYWPLFLAVVAIPASLQLLLLHCFPESPRFLLIERNDVCGATEGEGCPRGEPPACMRPTTLP